METTATTNHNAADEDDMDVVKEATWMLRHNDTLTHRISIEANWNQRQKEDGGEQEQKDSGRMVLTQVDALQRRPLPGGKLAPLDISSQSSATQGTKDGHGVGTHLSPSVAGKFRRRCMQIVRLSASVQGLPAAVAEAGTFLRVTMQNTEFGNDLAGRQVGLPTQTVAPSHDLDPLITIDLKLSDSLVQSMQPC